MPMLELPSALYPSTTLLPLGVCRGGRPELIWVQAIADAMLVVAAWSIPIAFAYYLHKRRNVVFHRLFLAIAAGIALCGFGFAADLWSLFSAEHAFVAPVWLAAAFTCWGAALACWPHLTSAVALPSAVELAAENERLRRERAELAEEQKLLSQQLHRLVEAEHVKDEFIANIAHEVRTPLTLVLAPIETLLMQSGHAQQIVCERQMLLTMQRNTVRLHRLFTALLEASKAGAGQLNPRREATLLVELTQNVCAEFAATASGRGIRLHCSADASVSIPALVDRYLYERIVANLVANAVKFTPQGGTVTVDLARENDHVKLTVSDTGKGIDASELPHLFERFARSDKHKDASGFGLSLVKEFAELLGGRVNVESESGKGARFTVEFLAPATTSEPAQGPVAHEPQEFPEPRDERPHVAHTVAPAADADLLPRVVIVEDNYDLADFIASLMKGSFAVCVAKKASEAEQLVRSWKPDLVLADVMVPKMDGLELCRKLKSDPDTAAIPFVLLTALTHRDAVMQGWDAGADDYLFKPFHPDELLTRVRSLMRSIGARKQAERELIEFNLRLEAEVKERTKDLALANAALSREIARFQKTQADLRRVQTDLEAAKEAAETANEAKSRFLANMSHEIRTPLGVVLGFSEMLIRNNLSDTEKSQCVAAIQRNGELLSNVINDILDLSKVEAGKLETEHLDVSVPGLLADIQGLFTLKARSKGLDFKVTADTPIPDKINTDPLRLRQILLNVIGNALKFTEHGAVMVRASTHMAPNGQQHLAFYVEDSGCGITKEQAARLFDPFSQGDVSATRKYGGTGLGLVLSRRLAQLLGGSVELVSSAPGKGSCFLITITTGMQPQAWKDDAPKASTPLRAGATVTPLPSSQARLDGLRVLLVDDSPDNQILVGRMLKRAGADVDVARNGREGIDRTEHGAYDVVLMDLQMPEMDGYEATAHLRRGGFKKPIIALTAHAMKEERIRCLSLGFNDHISKPVDYGQLLTSVCRHTRPQAEALH